MKKIMWLVLCGFLNFMNAQNKEVSVENSITSIQVGTVGVWINNEFKLTNKIALRTEFGLYTEIQKRIGFFMAPEISLEPRWYYNLEHRNKKNADIKNNSANFVTIKTNYRSNLFELSNHINKRSQNSFSIIPKWGIRRNLGSNFNIELGLGVGYQYYLGGNRGVSTDNSKAIVDLHLRLGYKI